MSGEPAAVVLPVDATSDDRAERLAALFDAHEDRLYRLARRLAASADDARDLVQDTFLRAAKSLRSVPVGLAKEEAWLVRVLVNIRRDQWRKTAVRKRSAATLRVDVTTYPSNLESAFKAMLRRHSASPSRSMPVAPRRCCALAKVTSVGH